MRGQTGEVSKASEAEPGLNFILGAMRVIEVILNKGVTSLERWL